MNDSNLGNGNGFAASSNVDVVIDGHEVTALVDTGADYSVFNDNFTRRLRNVTTQWDGPPIRTAGGFLVNPVGKCTACVQINGETCPAKSLILQNCAKDVILGMDFLREYGAVIDVGRDKLTLRARYSSPRPPLTDSSCA